MQRITLFVDKELWRTTVFKKYKDLTIKHTANNIVIHCNGVLVATFNPSANTGVIYT